MTTFFYSMLGSVVGFWVPLLILAVIYGRQVESEINSEPVEPVIDIPQESVDTTIEILKMVPYVEMPGTMKKILEATELALRSNDQQKLIAIKARVSELVENQTKKEGS